MNEEAMQNMKNAKRRDQHPFWIWESIMNTPKILSECLGGFTLEQVQQIAKKFREKEINKIFLLGTGSSYFATIAEKPIFEAFAGIPASTHLTTEFREYTPLTFDDHSAVFFHSHSGGTKGDPETVKNARDKGAYTIAVTDIPGSALAKSAEDMLIGPGGSKVELPATRTYSAAIFRMTQLAIELGKQSDKKSIALKAEEQLKQVPQILSKVADKYAALAPEIIEKLKECRSFFMVGAGGNYATADEAALGFSQSSGRPAQAFQLENFLHGPIQTLRKDIGVVLIAAPGPFQDRMLKTAQACKIIGSKVILLHPDDLDLPIDFDVCMDFPSNLTELISPLVYMTPLWQLAYYFSLLGEGSHTDRLSMDKPEFKEAFAVIMAGDKKFVK